MGFFENRTPWYFTSLCILAAGFVYHFSSPTPVETETQLASLFSQKEDLSCNCVLKSGEKFTELAYETPEECGPERSYYEDPLKKFKAMDKNGYFTKTRDFNESSKAVPRKCFLYAMKHTLQPVLTSSEFAYCDGTKVRTKDDPSDFSRTKYKACMTEDMVNVVYNSYLDAADCFDVPPKFAIAKFMNESGMTPNIIASNNDAGLSQFSNGAMAAMKRMYPDWSRKILHSSKPSCKRLLSYPGAVPRSQDEVISDPNLKCHLLEFPPNPIRNFVYYGVYYHVTKDDSDADFNRPYRYIIDPKTQAKTIDPDYDSTMTLLKQARMENFDIENIRQTMAIMSYNTGPRAVSYFREWLKFRNTKFPTVPIREDDLNMTIPNPWADSAGDTIDDFKRKFSIKDNAPLKFWEYLVIYTPYHFRYASYVKFYANRLDKIFGPGVCNEPNFLE